MSNSRPDFNARFHSYPDPIAYHDAWEAWQAATERAAEVVTEHGYKSNGTLAYEALANKIREGNE